jgi:RimJ/RimL family protein N-acetyltransferase
MDLIEAGPVVVRPLADSDVGDLVVACNDPLVRRFVTLPDPYTEVAARAFVSGHAPAVAAAGGLEGAVADPETGRLVGTVAVRALGRGCGEVGYWTAPWWRGRGAATAATRAVTGWAFAHGFARLELLTDPENGPSQRVAIANGYSWEGLRRDAGQYGDGSRYDLVSWSRLPADPPGPATRLLPDLPGGQISDGTVTLRRLTPDDVDDLHRLQALPEIVAGQVPAEPHSRDELVRRCARAETAWLAGHQAGMSIRDTATGAFAGDIAVFYREPNTGQAMIGYDLAPEWRGRGYARRAVRLLSEWVFGHTGIARLIAGTAPGNVASQRVLEAAGFRREGYQRSRVPGAGGARVDDLLYALLPPDLLPEDR